MTGTTTTGQTPTPGDDGWSAFLGYLKSRHDLVDLTEIGKGGMGRVYRARDENLGRWVAVKVLAGAAATPESLRRFRQESKILASLKHPAIVDVYSAGTSPAGVSYFVMDLVTGGDLGSRIAARRERNSPFTVAETVAQLRPVADALDTIHGTEPQVIHRDVKPANILVPDRHGPWNASILTDFGISLSQDETRMTSAGFLIGTDRYMAPEQFRSVVDGGPTPGASVDRYAFALIVFEMLTLRPMRDTMGQEAWRFARRFQVPPEDAFAAADRRRTVQIGAVLARALADDPAHRYPTAMQLLDALSTAAGGSATGSGRPAGGAPATAYTAGLPSPARNRGGYGGRGGHAGQGTRDGRTAQTRQGPVQQSTYPTYASAPTGPTGTSAPRKSTGRRVLVTVLALLVVLALVGAGAAVIDKVRHPTWSGGDATVAAAFPRVIPSEQNGTGWLGMTCSSGTPADHQHAQILCSGDGRMLVVADFGDAASRDEYGAATDLTDMSDGTCTIRTGEVDQGTATAWVALPQEAGKDRYSLLLSGDTAGADITGIPVC